MNFFKKWKNEKRPKLNDAGCITFWFVKIFFIVFHGLFDCVFDQLNREKWKETEAKKSAHHAANPIARSVHIVAWCALDGKELLGLRTWGLGDQFHLGHCETLVCCECFVLYFHYGLRKTGKSRSETTIFINFFKIVLSPNKNWTCTKEPWNLDLIPLPLWIDPQQILI